MNESEAIEGVVDEGQAALFDYTELDQQVQMTLKVRASEIQTLAKRMAADVVDIGDKLAEVKDILGGNGRFNNWLQAELRWSERTAYNFIAVHQKFGAANFALENVAASALYLLSAPSTPPEAIAVAKQIAESGETVTHTVAKELVRQAKKSEPKQAALIEEPEPEETGGELAEVSQNIPENITETITSDDQAICLCTHLASVHEPGGACGECSCEIYEEDTRSDAQREAETMPEPTMKAAPAPKAKTVDSVKADSEIEKEFAKAKIEMSVTLMPGDGDIKGRMIIGSINAEGYNSLIFHTRGFEDFALSKLETALTQFKSEILTRRQQVKASAPATKQAKYVPPKKTAKAKKAKAK